jgi:uncharacterized peroxidase-related enzyme
METKPLSRFPVPELDALPDDIREQILAVQERTGFVPNVFMVLAHRPDEFRAFMAYYTSLMEKSEGLTKAEREMIVVATSAANDCPYCVVAHGAVLRIRAKHAFLADQLAVNYRCADITPRQRVMLDFALQVSQYAETIEDDDVEALRQYGFSDDEIWDIGAISAFFAMSNRMAALTGMWPNEAFYTLGRSLPATTGESAPAAVPDKASSKKGKGAKGAKKGKKARA